MSLKPGDPLTLLRPDEVAQILRVTPATLAIWRCTGRQLLAYVKVGRSVRYRRAAVEKYLQAHERGAE